MTCEQIIADNNGRETEANRVVMALPMMLEDDRSHRNCGEQNGERNHAER
jgi:hypothetical protein